MLKSMRKNMKAIMWILLVTFVLWGGSSAVLSRSKTTNYAGIMFNKKIGWKEYEQNLSAVENQAKLMYGEKFNEIKQYLKLEQQVWDRILLLRQASKKHINVSNSELLETLCKVPLFQDSSGKFVPQIYKQVVEYFLRVPAREFEDQFKDTMKIGKLRDKITKDIAITDKGLAEEYKIKNEKIAADYAMINANDFKPQVNISDADIDKYYRLHSEEFKTPLRVKIEYIPFEYNNYKKDASVSPEEIDKYYQAHKKDYEKELSDAKEKGTAQPDAMAKVQERIRVTLIDKKAKEMADEASSDASYELMQAQHPDFYGIAKKFNLAVKESNFFAMSEPITDIGFSYEVAFEAFKLEPGQISSPIKAQSGRYIIKLKDKKEPYVPPLDEVQKQVKDIVTAEEAKKLADKKAQEMLALIEQKMRQGGTFKKACAELKLKAASTGLFTKEGYIPQLGESKEFAELAFGQRPGRLAGAAKTSQGSAIIFVTKKLKADEEKFEKEKSEFRKTALQEKETKYFTTWFEDLKKKANIKVSTEASNRKSQSTSSSQGPYAPLPLDDF